MINQYGLLHGVPFDLHKLHYICIRPCAVDLVNQIRRADEFISKTTKVTVKD